MKKAGWFESLSTRQPAFLRLFCFPYAGASAQVFRSWQTQLGPEIEMCLVHLPGRGHRINEPCFTRLEPLVNTIADAIVPETRGPFAFYGHSMGAIISFELARELQRRQLAAPAHLFVSGRLPPSEPPGHRSFDLPLEQFIAELRELNGTPADLLLNPDTRDLFLPVLRADFEIVDTYTYKDGPPLACPFSVYGGIADDRVPVEQLSGWQAHTSAQCRVRVLPGDHFFIQDHKSEFIEVLRRDLLSSLPRSATHITNRY